MFERFTDPARDVVVTAQGAARRLDHRLIATPHLLLALLDSPAADLLTAHGVTRDAVEGRLADLARRDPRAADDDAAVLATLGIDMARIRAAVEARFGAGALDADLTPPAEGSLLRRLRPGRQRTPRDEVEALRRAGGSRAGHLPFSPSAKKVLELSLREAVRLGSRSIGPEHVTLGLLRCGDGAAAAVLDQLGTDVGAVREDVERRLRRSA